MENRIRRAVTNVGSVLAKLFLYLWCGFSIFVFFWLIFCSLKTNREFFKEAWGLPAKLQWENYLKVFREYDLGQNF